MKITFLPTLFLLSTLALSCVSYGTAKLPELKGPYLGQTPPSLKPEVFAPGIISTKGWEYGVVFAPNMNEMYFVREVDADTDPKQEFVVYENHNGTWQERVISPRTGTPTLSTDGNIMYFGRAYKQCTDTGWSEFKSIGEDFKEIPIMRLTSSNNGTFVFDEMSDESVLRYSNIVNGVRQAPKPLPAHINEGEYNAHPFIVPDESYIIWDAKTKKEGSNPDLFISFKQADGSWGESIKMNDSINTEASEFAAFVTPDGKYLFFNRNIGPDNTDTFWVDAKVIEELRPKLL